MRLICLADDLHEMPSFIFCRSSTTILLSSLWVTFDEISGSYKIMALDQHN